MVQTHRVENQPLALADYDAFTGNRALVDGLAYFAPDLDTSGLVELGHRITQPEMQEHARLANLHKPMLRTHDRQGRRIDEVEFHPSYHRLMAHAIGAGLASQAWFRQQAHAHLERAAGFMLATELEPSVLCPVSMSYAVVPALQAHPGLLEALRPALARAEYDPQLRPLMDKRGLTLGMGMTEKQGGSDVRANTTEAQADGQDGWGERHRITGHKWFFSAPMSDAFLILAQKPEGLTCFFLPRVLPDGQRNAIFIQRLKDKLGNHANASSEVEFEDALAWQIGEAGQGVRQILQMGVMTRLDCVLGTAGLMRAALSLAIDHARQRKAFGRTLSEHGLMQAVLADLALDCEAACLLALRLANSFDQMQDPHEQAVQRVLTPVAKFWICKRGAAFAQEAMECLGGNGYVEEQGQGTMARIYREMPLNSIWEGAGNIMALDLLRALRRVDMPALIEREFGPVRGFDERLDAQIVQLAHDSDRVGDEAQARLLAGRIALIWQAVCLIRIAPEAIARAFCRARLSNTPSSSVYGMLPSEIDFATILERARPR